MLDELFTKSCAEISDAYARLDHQLGWRFLTSPKKTFGAGVDVALISLNPGGGVDIAEHPRASSEAGSAYLVESWDGCPPGRAPLQIQVRKLFEALAATRDSVSGSELMANALSAYFIPFRSPGMATLVNRKASIAFATDLWAKLLPALNPRVIMTMDTTSTPILSQILTTQLGVSARSTSLPVGWGSYAAELQQFETPDLRKIIVRLPHLSRFKIFGRHESRPYITAIFAEVAKSLDQRSA